MKIKSLPHRAALAVAFFALPPLSCAHAAGEVHLEDVVAAALKDGPAIRLANAKVAQANGQLQQAQGAFDWDASGKTGWQRLYVPHISNGFLTNELDTENSIYTTVGFTKLFRNGIQIEPGVSFFTDTAATQAQTLGLTRPQPHLNLDIPLWRGSGSNNLPAATERAAQDTLGGAKLDQDYARDRVVHDAVQIYWRCVALQRQIGILESAQHEGDDYVASLRHQVETGQIEPTLLDRARADEAVQKVEFSKVQGQAQTCSRDLGIAMGATSADSHPAVTGDLPAMDAMSNVFAKLNEQDLIDTALRRRQDFQALTQYVHAAVEQVEGARNATRPQVDLSLDTDGVFVNISKSLQGNLEQGQLEVAEAAESQARINLDVLRNQIGRDVSDQVHDLKEALSNWQTLRQSAQTLEDVVASAGKRARAGIIPWRDQRDAVADLLQVRRQLVDTELLFASDLAALRLSTGTIEATTESQPQGLAARFRSAPDNLSTPDASK